MALNKTPTFLKDFAMAKKLKPPVDVVPDDVDDPFWELGPMGDCSECDTPMVDLVDGHRCWCCKAKYDAQREATRKAKLRDREIIEGIRERNRQRAERYRKEMKGKSEPRIVSTSH